MKKITTTRKTNRRPARERKNPSGAQNQLSRRRSKVASRKSKDNPMETTLEQPINEIAETAVVEPSKERQSEFSRGQLGKAKRAFAKAGKEASEANRSEWLSLMAKNNIAVMDYSSSKLSKLIKGEITISELLKQ